MTRTLEAALVVAFGLGLAGAAAAQGSGKVPVTRDLQRLEESDRRLGIDRDHPGFEPNVRPWNPAGIVGYAGPPWGTYGDTVTNTGPLPPGNPLNEQ